MSKGRVRKLRADLGEAAIREDVLSARLRAQGAALMLNREQLEMVQEWFAWAADSGVESAYTPEGQDLLAKVEQALDNGERVH